MSIRAVLSAAESFRPIDARGRYVPRLAALRGTKAAGVYGILDARGRFLYIGESHAGSPGRMYDTITRHFRAWELDPEADTYGRRRGGATYDRSRVRVVFRLTDPADAEDLQFALIQELQPRDNSADGSSLEPAPF